MQYDLALVVFFCCFQALRAEDFGEPISLAKVVHLEGEERLFDCLIFDDGYHHDFGIYKDTGTGVVRLQASVHGGEMRNSPVWTAFITHVLYSSSWKIKAGRIIYLADLQPIVFTLGYTPGADAGKGFVLDFVRQLDADQFWDTIDDLKALRKYQNS